MKLNLLKVSDNHHFAHWEGFYLVSHSLLSLEVEIITVFHIKVTNALYHHLMARRDDKKRAPFSVNYVYFLPFTILSLDKKFVVIKTTINVAK